MHKFRQVVADRWLFRKEVEMFTNFARNWDKGVKDYEFLGLFANPDNTSSEEAEKFMKAYFGVEELQKVGVSFGVDGECEDSQFVGDMTVADWIQRVWNRKEMRKRCRAMLEEWGRVMVHRKVGKAAGESLMEGRFREVVKVLELSEVEAEILAYACVREFTSFCGFPCGRSRVGPERVLYAAMATDYPYGAVEKAFRGSGKLLRYSVLDGDGDLSRRSPVRGYIESGDGEILEGRYFRKASGGDILPWRYYGKLVEVPGEVLRRMIGGGAGKRGVNILFYGAPGTGKTSFGRTLAHELGLEVYEVLQGGKDGTDDSVQNRMAGIRLCNERVVKNRSLILIDEADQLLRGRMGSFLGGGFMFGNGAEKGVINSILDEIRHPTIWIANTPAGQMDESVRRRFDYSICFEELNGEQRRAIWRNNVEKLGLGKHVTCGMIEKLAGKYATSAGGITMVLENVKRMKVKKGEVEGMIDTLMRSHCELMGLGKKGEVRQVMPASDYSLEGLNLKGDIELGRIVEAVRNFCAGKVGARGVDVPRMNLLLWGPPGTGKTEFVKYLASELKKKVHVRMGSDILSMWVGGTEQNIRRAFRAAEDEGAILFLDEIDGLVQDRTGAQRSFEVTQVNELLHQMENFNGVMIGATNFMANLDQAILRRFTFKMQFDYLDGRGKKIFFERMFKARLSAAELKRLEEIWNLAPGDFRTVRQAMFCLGGDITNAQLLTELEKESALKKSTQMAGHQIGFKV